MIWVLNVPVHFVSLDLLFAETPANYDRTFWFYVSVLEQLAQKTFWHSEQKSTTRGTSISTLVCYQIPSFQANHSG